MEKIVEYSLLKKAEKPEDGKVIAGSAKVNGIVFPTTISRWGKLKGKEDMVDISALNLGVKWLKIPHSDPEDIIDLNAAEGEELKQITPDYADLSLATVPEYLDEADAFIFRGLLNKAIQAKKQAVLDKELDKIDALEAQLAKLKALRQAVRG